MTSDVRNEVLQRMLFAKLLQRHGHVACAERNDRYAFARGILLLHDAAESGLAAVADHLHAKITKQNMYLLEYYDHIEMGSGQPEQRIVPYRTQMKILNTVRNGIKHQGVFPDAHTHGNLPSAVLELLRDLCRVYLIVDYDSLSLRGMIRNERVRTWIDSAEDKIQAGDFEGALVSLGYAMYQLAEFRTTGLLGDALAGRAQTGLKFTNPHTSDFTIVLLEHGVDPFTYHRFRDLTPRMAYDRDGRQVVHRWGRMFGHSMNWTYTNAQFCLEFCTDCALKFETRPAYEYDIVRYEDAYEDVIEPMGDAAVFYNCGENAEGFFTANKPKRVPIWTLESGRSIVGVVMEEHSGMDTDEWTVFSEDIPGDGAWPGGLGVVKKDAVRVTSRARRNEPGFI